MAITIENNGASLKIEDGDNLLCIKKSNPWGLETSLENAIIKLDIGQGALNKLFLLIRQSVTAPASTGVEDPWRPINGTFKPIQTLQVL